MVERESKTQKDAMTLLRKRGCYVYKNAQNMYTEKGRPDLTACVPVTLNQLIKYASLMDEPIFGLFLGIEMKRPGKLYNTSDAQEVVGRQIKKSKGLWLAIDNVDVLKKQLDIIQGDNNVI